MRRSSTWLLGLFILASVIALRATVPAEADATYSPTINADAPVSYWRLGNIGSWGGKCKQGRKAKRRHKHRRGAR